MSDSFNWLHNRVPIDPPQSQVRQPKKPLVPTSCPYCQAQNLQADESIPIERDTMFNCRGLGMLFTCLTCNGELIVPAWE